LQKEEVASATKLSLPTQGSVGLVGETPYPLAK